MLMALTGVQGLAMDTCQFRRRRVWQSTMARGERSEPHDHVITGITITIMIIIAISIIILIIIDIMSSIIIIIIISSSSIII